MLNKSIAVITSIACVIFVQHGTAQILNHDTRITVKVIGENQEPISNALVKIAFGQERQLGKAIQIEGQSDSNGLFSAEHGSDGHVFWSATKEGYYSSTGYDFQFNSALVESGRWQPWNQVFEVLMKKIIHPVPMFVKIIETEIPKKQMPVGFDLEIGDWVSPNGIGVVNDLLFTLSQAVTDNDNYEAKLEITFSNRGDGIQETAISSRCGSLLKFPHQAPESGYSDLITIEQGRRNNISFGQRYSSDRAYFIRMRTVLDEKGNVRSAKYGKIGDSIMLSGIAKEHVYLRFVYYLNPDGTRNLEYNGENLFKDDKRQYAP